MIDIVDMEIRLMRQVAESIQMEILIRLPVGVHLPEHPLCPHLIEAASSPGIPLTVA